MGSFRNSQRCGSCKHWIGDRKILGDKCVYLSNERAKGKCSKYNMEVTADKFSCKPSQSSCTGFEYIKK